MSTRLTYTSGDLGAETDAAFEEALEAARGSDADPRPHLIGGEEVARARSSSGATRRTPIGWRAARTRPDRSWCSARSRRRGRPRPPGRAHPYDERCRLLRAAADGIGERHMELAALASLETGKSRTEAILEVQEAIDLIEAYAGHMEENGGYTQPLNSFVEGERNVDVLRPYGVFGVIAPFNFPVALSIGMASSALIAGNTVVFKPSEETPATGAALGGDRAGGRAARRARSTSCTAGRTPGARSWTRDVDGIAFTGSAEVGREIARKLQDGPYARPALTEMGGKNPAIVTESADVDAAAEGVARSAFGLSGQKCSACSRAIVADSVYDEFVDRLAARAGELALGDPSDPAMFVGPVINEGAVERYERAVDAGAARRAAWPPAAAARTCPGHYVEPTVVADLPHGHELERDELFLPFVTVTRVSSFDEALAEANAPVYGLTAGIFTGDEAEKERFLAEIQAGVVYVNRRAGATTGAWPGTQTFCGWKSSGSTGKGGLGAWYLPQFMREQSRTIVE